ncbi:MAG TPA: hypothetical protein DCF63_11995, partial [Planctomycetaceae bacterium]|nr:hypothetical protein [Planctomycetaceae bacterium]
MNWNRLRRSLRSRNRVALLRKDLLVERLEERLVLQGIPLNRPPVNVVPDTQSVIQGGLLAFHSAAGNRISLSDPDAATSSLQVTLSTSKGLLSLLKPGAVRFVKGDGLADSEMVFPGSQAKINEALSSIYYVSPANYTGAAKLSITTNDLGGTGRGGPKSDTDTVTININPISLGKAKQNTATASAKTSSSNAQKNQAPAFTKGPNQTVLEDSGPKTVTAWATGISRGSANESTQSLSFLVSNNNTALFATQPSIAPNGA